MTTGLAQESERGNIMAQIPKWVTPERQAHLVNLFLRSGGFCIYGHKPCPYPDHHYVNFTEGLIQDWIDDDREERQALWQAEQRAMHDLHERGSWADDSMLLPETCFMPNSLCTTWKV